MNATTTERKALTEIQAKVLAYLVKCVELEDRIPPNHVIAKDFGWASPTAANEHLRAIERKGWLTRTHYGALMLADRPVHSAPLTGKQRLYLAQAWELLEDYAQDQRKAGNDSIADGAEASAHEIKQLLAPGFIGMEHNGRPA